jgi:hypothetical protein
MRTAVNMDGIRLDIELRNGVVEHVKMWLENVPVDLRNTISGFPTVDGSKFEWSVNERIEMCQIDPFAKRM